MCYTSPPLNEERNLPIQYIWGLRARFSRPKVKLSVLKAELSVLKIDQTWSKAHENLTLNPVIPTSNPDIGLGAVNKSAYATRAVNNSNGWRRPQRSAASTTVIRIAFFQDKLG
jgi:hypothetical protein